LEISDEVYEASFDPKCMEPTWVLRVPIDRDALEQRWLPLGSEQSLERAATAKRVRHSRPKWISKPRLLDSQ
jgi:hypothetical protein